MFHRAMNYGELEVRPGQVVTRECIRKNLPKFRMHEDLVIIQQTAWDDFKRAMPLPVASTDENSPLSIDEDELASLVCQTIQRPGAACRRLAVERSVMDDGYWRPNVRILLGDNGVVTHMDNQILYCYDITKCALSFGNIREKIRMAELDCSSETVVDLFAGIGHFALPLLVHARTRHLFACERNSDALEALRRNLKLNKVDSSRYTIIEGDNRAHRPMGVAQRVVLGILPSSLGWMKTALECVDRKTGAILHCHDLVDPNSWAQTKTMVFANSAPNGKSQNSLDKQSSTCEPNATPPSLDSQSTLNQSLSSCCSTSSHSTAEKLPASPDESRLSNSLIGGDKDTSSPVLLDKPSLSNTNSSLNSSFLDTTAHTNSTHEQTSLIQSQHEDSMTEPPLIEESEMASYEARGFALIARIRDDLVACNMAARLLQVQPVRSYGSNITHVVFDIKLEPQGPTLKPTTNSAQR